MSDTVIIVIVIAILVAVIVALRFGGHFQLWWNNLRVSARGNQPSGGPQTMKAVGPGSEIKKAKQISTSDAPQKMQAEAGGHIYEVEQRSTLPKSEQNDTAPEP